MMNSRFYLLAAALVTLAACGNDNEMTDNATNNGELVPLQVTGSISGAKTRITLDNQWETGDEIGISGISGKLTYSNYYYIYKSDAEFEPGSAGTSNKIYFGSATGKFNAYYPYRAKSSIKDGKITQTMGNYIKTRDLLFAKDLEVSKGDPLALEFDHKMSMLVLHMKAGTGFFDSSFSNDGRSIMIGFSSVKSQVAFDITNGTATPTGDPLEPFSPTAYNEPTSGYYYRVILCPETIEGGITFSFNKDNVTYTALLTTNKEEDNPVMEMEPGKVYEYTITVHKTEMIPSKVTINSWEKAWNGSNDVEATV